MCTHLLGLVRSENLTFLSFSDKRESLIPTNLAGGRDPRYRHYLTGSFFVHAVLHEFRQRLENVFHRSASVSVRLAT